MTLRRRILLHYSATISLSLVLVAGWSWFEFNEQRDIMLQGGVAAATKESPLVETLEIILFGGLPAILLGIFGARQLMRLALRPVEELTVALEQTDASNLAEPVARSGNGDELDRMTAVFNGMKERLGASFTQAREFTLHASHELKTPLTILHGTLEQMLTTESAAAQTKEKIASMLEEVQRLTTTVGQLAFLAKADAGTLAAKREAVALHELVRDVADEAAILGSSAAITVTTPKLEAVNVNGDRMRLRQLLLNLADNAVKYNEARGTIQISLCRQNGSAVLTVSNTGPALPPELSARVFERFFRGDLAHASTIEGSGLGLSIAKSIVEAHQGEIRYEVLPDQRTQLTVCLPLSA